MMNPTHNPTTPDDLDRMLAAYFTRELPHPWPTCPSVGEPVMVQAVPSSRVPAHQADSLSRSRLTLAASVAALLGLGLFVSSDVRQQPTARKVTPDSATAPIDLSKTTADGSRHPMSKQDTTSPMR